MVNTAEADKRLVSLSSFTSSLGYKPVPYLALPELPGRILSLAEGGLEIARWRRRVAAWPHCLDPRACGGN